MYKYNWITLLYTRNEQKHLKSTIPKYTIKNKLKKLNFKFKQANKEAEQENYLAEAEEPALFEKVSWLAVTTFQFLNLEALGFVLVTGN